MSSAANLIYTYRKAFSDSLEKAYFGTSLLEGFAVAMDQCVKARKDNPHLPIVDIAYSELTASPRSVIDKIYDRYGRTLSADASAKISNWETANKQHKQGVHNHSLEEFSINRDMLNAKLDHYIDHFRDFL